MTLRRRLLGLRDRHPRIMRPAAVLLAVACLVETVWLFVLAWPHGDDALGALESIAAFLFVIQGMKAFEWAFDHGDVPFHVAHWSTRNQPHWKEIDNCGIATPPDLLPEAAEIIFGVRRRRCNGRGGLSLLGRLGFTEWVMSWRCSEEEARAFAAYCAEECRRLHCPEDFRFQAAPDHRWGKR